ncbi:MAG: hypothetical protein GWN58_57265, partial [Anaerolineae bacterium]|nr:hypothetical protein [Anaerolineae bacterium]
MASDALDKWVREARDQHKRKLTELLRPYPLQELEAQVYLLKGEPGHLIPELATKLGVEL